MPHTWKATLILSLALSITILTGLSVSAAGTFTITGQVRFPDGRPAPGLGLKIFALDPPDGVDGYNAIWKIPNYDPHPVTTDADGRYTMTGVIDYPENPTHWYTVRVMEETSHVWHGGIKFRLWQGKWVEQADIRLEKAAWVAIKLKDKDGKPFNGRRVVYFQTGTDLTTPTKGYCRPEEVNFVNGEGGIRVVMRDEQSPVARVAITDVPSRGEVKRLMEEKGLKTASSSLDGFKLAHKDAHGRALDQKVQLTPLTEVSVEFVL